MPPLLLQGFDDASSGDTAGAGVVDGLYYLVIVEFNPFETQLPSEQFIFPGVSFSSG